MRLFSFGIAMTPIALAAAAAWPQAASVPGCYLRHDDERCLASRVGRQREVYGLPTVDRLGGQGAQVRRVFMVDRRGRDAGALSFTRRRGERPRVTFQLPLRRGLEPAIGEVPLPLWTQILERSRAFDRARFAPPDGVCADAWEFLVEAADPPGSAGAAGPRRRSVDMCAGFDHPLWLADVAAGLLPGCDSLDPGTHGSGLDRLSACAIFQGDRPAAARVWDALQPMTWLDQPSQLEALRAAFDGRVALDWRGERIHGRDAAIARWRSGLAERPGAEFYWSRITALPGGRAELQGDFIDVVRDGDDRRVATDASRVTMAATRDGAGRLRIVHARVAPFRRVGGESGGEARLPSR